MKFALNNILPRDPSKFAGFLFVRIITGLYMAVIVVRSCIHIFSADGGANSIAGIDLSVGGGNNIIAIFHQWGAIQLLLVLLQLVIFFRYPGLTSLVLASLVADPILREIAGQMMPVTSTSTPPGAALNAPAFFFVLALFIVSFMQKKPKVAA